MIFKGERITPNDPFDMRVKIKHNGKWKVIDHMRKGDIENLGPEEAKLA